MADRYDINRLKVKTAVAVFDPADEISKLVVEGKISGTEAQRIQNDFGADRMSADQVHDYVRQKRR